MATLSLDSSQFEKGMRSAEKGGKNLANKLSNSFTRIQRIIKTSLAVVAVKKLSDAMLGLASATATAGDRIDKQSQKLGMSRRAYQEWDYILSQSGADIDSMANAMATLNVNIQEGSKETTEAFKQLGVDMDMLNSLNVEDQFAYLVNLFQQYPNGAAKSALATKIFGRQGKELLPLLNSTSAEMYDLKEKMEELGLYMSDEAVDASVKYNDSVDTLKRTFNSLRYAIGAKLLPVLNTAVNDVTDYVAKLKKAFEEDGLAGVWQTIVNDIANINWPTWDDVKNAALTAWDTIVKGVTEDLPALIFGRTEDGKVAWPTWNDVKKAAEDAWNAIKLKALGIADDFGALIFGRTEDGKVAWPTWDDIKQGAIDLWNTIKEKVTTIADTLGGLVFGRTSDGKVDWPTWEDIKQGAIDLWNTIKEKAVKLGDTLGGWVFGRKEDGSVDWPTWDDIKQGAEDLWNTIKLKAMNIADTLGGLVFGREEDGSVAWPKFSSLVQVGAALWGKIVGWAANLGGLIFGRDEAGDVKWPDLDDVFHIIQKAWNGLLGAVAKLPALIFGEDSIISDSLTSALHFIQDVGKWAIDNWKLVSAALAGIFGAIEITKLVNLVSAHPILSAIVTLLTLIATNWDTIKPVVMEIAGYLDTYIVQPIKSVVEWLEKLAKKLGLVGDEIEQMPRRYKESAPVAGYEDAVDWVDSMLTDAKVEQGTGFASDLARSLMGLDADLFAAKFNISTEEAEKLLLGIKGTMEAMTGETYELKFKATVDYSELPDNAESTIPLKDGGAGRKKKEYNAKGLWSVPYDDYITRLHRGERVLSASQARQGGGADTDAIVQAVTSAVTQSMKSLVGSLKIVVNNKAFGQVVADTSTSRINNGIASIQDKIAYGYGR